MKFERRFEHCRQAEVEGEGLVDAVKLGYQLIFGRRELDSASAAVFNKHKNEMIHRLEPFRTQLKYLTTFAVNVVSGMKFSRRQRKHDLEKLYHVGVVVHIGNTRIMVEKHSEIRITESGVPPNSESLSMNVASPLTLSTLLSRTKGLMGERKFFSYSASVNNCQDFAASMLRANGLATSETDSFLKQDVSELFDDQLKNTSDLVTDLASRGNLLKDYITNEGTPSFMRKQHDGTIVSMDPVITPPSVGDGLVGPFHRLRLR